MNLLITVILIFIGAAAISAALYWYAFRYEPINFKLSEIKVYIRNKAEKTEKQESILQNNLDCRNEEDFPAGFKSEKTAGKPILEILHLSDFHLRKGRKGYMIFNFVKSLESLNPDLVFITGDLVEKNENFSYLVDMLQCLKASAGKYAVLGVHDYYNKTPAEFFKNMIKRRKEYRRENDVEELIIKLNSTGIKVLRNELVFHKSGDIKVAVLGLEDSIIRKADVRSAFNKSGSDGLSNLKNMLFTKTDIMQQKPISCPGAVPGSDFNEPAFGYGRWKTRYREVFEKNYTNIHSLNNENRILICLTHTPDMDLFVDLADKNTDIIFCGHTHGGQVRLPLVGALLSGCNIKARHCSGLFYFKKFILYTSRGLGEGRYSPFRFYCSPEASLIKIYMQ